MATAKKKSSKRTLHRIDKPAPWAKSKIPSGTVTVTISLAHVENIVQAFVKSLRDPKKLAVLQSALQQILAEKTAKKGKRAGKVKAAPTAAKKEVKVT
jgi:hypothetical protein